jgi:hypothetical protein
LGLLQGCFCSPSPHFGAKIAERDVTIEQSPHLRPSTLNDPKVASVFFLVCAALLFTYDLVFGSASVISIIIPALLLVNATINALKGWGPISRR